MLFKVDQQKSSTKIHVEWSFKAFHSVSGVSLLEKMTLAVGRCWGVQSDDKGDTEKDKDDERPFVLMRVAETTLFQVKP